MGAEKHNSISFNRAERDGLRPVKADVEAAIAEHLHTPRVTPATSLKLNKASSSTVHATVGDQGGVACVRRVDEYYYTPGCTADSPAIGSECAV